MERWRDGGEEHRRLELGMKVKWSTSELGRQGEMV
jgi:hypothetical protein